MTASASRAAVIERYGTAPRVADHRTNANEGALLALTAASLNPADLAIASGNFPAGNPPLPYVPGIDGIAEVVASERFAPGSRVAVVGGGVGVTRDGTWADHFWAPDAALLEVPDDVDAITAAAVLTPGLTAWLAMTHIAELREGESVLVLGATGTLGSVALQAARLLSAGHVIAVGRSTDRLERCRSDGAHAVVSTEAPDLTTAFAEAAGDRPPDVIIDPLYGRAFESALAVAAPAARIVHVGQSAAATATLASGLLRGKRLTVQGMSLFFIAREVLQNGCTTLLEHVRDGRVTVGGVTVVALDDAADAWAAKASGDPHKIVVTP